MDKAAISSDEDVFQNPSEGINSNFSLSTILICCAVSLFFPFTSSKEEEEFFSDFDKIPPEILGYESISADDESQKSTCPIDSESCNVVTYNEILKCKFRTHWPQ